MATRKWVSTRGRWCNPELGSNLFVGKYQGLGGWNYIGRKGGVLGETRWMTT